MMRVLITRRILGMVFLLATAGCSSSTPSTPSASPTPTPTPPAPTGPGGTLTAIVDGVAFTNTVRASNTGTFVSVSALSTVNANTLQIGFVASATAGTTTPGPASPTSLTFTSGPQGTLTASWTAGARQGNGTLTIATLTATGMSGIFSFNAPPTAQPLGGGSNRHQGRQERQLQRDVLNVCLEQALTFGYPRSAV